MSSGFACVEVCQGKAWISPRNLSWWIAVINFVGSIAFQISACFAFIPFPYLGDDTQTAAALEARWNQWFLIANVNTAIGGICFFVAAYLLLPEMLDGE